MPEYDKSNLQITKGLIDAQNNNTKAVISFVILAASIYLAYAFSLPAIIITPILLPFMAFTYYAFGSIQTLYLDQSYSSEQMGTSNYQFNQTLLLNPEDLKNEKFTELKHKDNHPENDDQLAPSPNLNNNFIFCGNIKANNIAARDKAVRNHFKKTCYIYEKNSKQTKS